MRSGLLWTERLFYWDPRNTTDISIHLHHLDKSAILEHSINLDYCMQLQYINILPTTSRYICLKNMPLCRASKTVFVSVSFLFLPPTHLYLFHLFFPSYPSLFLPRLYSLNNPVPKPPSPSALRNSPLRVNILYYVLLTTPCHLLVCYEPHIYPHFLYICNIFPC